MTSSETYAGRHRTLEELAKVNEEHEDFIRQHLQTAEPSSKEAANQVRLENGE